MVAISGWRWRVSVGRGLEHRSERAQRGAGVILSLETGTEAGPSGFSIPAPLKCPISLVTPFCLSAFSHLHSPSSG